MLGTRLVLPDGRVYKYAKSGASTITIGRIVGAQAQPAGLIIDCLGSAVQARTTAQWDAGTHTVITATTSSATASNHISANRYDDGYLWVTDQAGEGQMLQIKSHGISTSSGSTSVTMTMYDEELLTIALTTASQFGLVPNLYSGVVIHTGTKAGGPALGVAPIAVAASKYFWLQTWGPCPVCAGVALPVAGQPVIAINTTGTSTGATAQVAGSCYASNSTLFVNTYLLAAVNLNIGFCLVPPTADADFSLIFLTISP